MGIENRNFIETIGGNFFTIMIVHVRILLVIMIERSKKCSFPKGKLLIKRISPKKPYLEFMVSFIIQMYCEFLMATIINFENLRIFAANENPTGLSNGDRFAQMTAGDMFSFFFAIIWFIVLAGSPILFVLAIKAKSKEVVLSKESGVIKNIEQEHIFKDLWSELELRSDNKWVIHYYTFYFARRLSMILFCYYS